jgi:hypothetical protein
MQLRFVMYKLKLGLFSFGTSMSFGIPKYGLINYILYPRSYVGTQEFSADLGVNAIGKENKYQIKLRIDPNACASEAGVPKG